MWPLKVFVISRKLNTVVIVRKAIKMDRSLARKLVLISHVTSARYWRAASEKDLRYH